MGLPGRCGQRRGDGDDGPGPRVLWTPTLRWPRSTRSSSPRTARSYALDAKINFDDNALYRHKDLIELRDLNEEDPLEVEASQVTG